MLVVFKILNKYFFIFNNESILVLKKPFEKHVFLSGIICEENLDAYEVFIQLSWLALKYFQMCLI